MLFLVLLGKYRTGPELIARMTHAGVKVGFLIFSALGDVIPLCMDDKVWTESS